MKIWLAAAECVPFAKTGGLADVIGALPKALQKENVEVRVVLPKFSKIPSEYKNKMKLRKPIEVPVGWRRAYCGIEELVHDGITYYFLDNEYYFARDSLYGQGDDGERFAFFNRAVLEVLPHLDYQPDLIHSHDWHTGMVSVLLQAYYRNDPFYRSIRTVYTIHNLRYQGLFPYEVFGELFGLDNRFFTYKGVEYYGALNFMKGGIVYSDRVTTVSPTYSKEIRSPYYGEGLDGLLRSVEAKLSGIVNGIDDTEYNPATDRFLHARYRSDLSAKQTNKRELQLRLGLPVRSDAPLIGMVTRLVSQKGLDLVAHVLDELLASEEVQFIVLGTGDAQYERFFREAARRFPDRLAALISFDEGLARSIYASSDMFLMPSQFEPCGLGQLIALRYGSVPIVRETGGLNDTVQAYNDYTGEGNGFTFTNYNAHDMLHTIRRSLAFYRQPEHWKRLVKNALEGDYSWRRSALHYKELYEELIYGAVRETEQRIVQGTV